MNNLFEIIRKNQKDAGDIFLFNKLTNEIVEIIIRLYHANITKISSLKDNKVESFMCGILQDNDANIYITIAGEPEEDNAGTIGFYKKINYFVDLLDESNIKYKLSKNSDHKLNKELLKRTNKRIIKNEKNIPPNIKTFKNISFKPFSFSDNEPLTVKLINSEEYLYKRKLGYSFIPFKRHKEDGKITCNNGSTCAESKLYSYLYSINKKWSDIKGFVSYWIGTKYPPEHINKSYSYEQITDIKLSKMIKNFNAPHNKLSKYKHINDNDYNETIKYIFQPISLACPGCLLNLENYKTNKMEVFNYLDCNLNKNQTDFVKHHNETILKISNSRNIIIDKYFDKTFYSSLANTSFKTIN